MTPAEKRVNQAKINLFTAKSSTFFSVLLAQLKIIWDPNFPTAGTDGIRLVLNPNFIEPLDIKETIGLLLHEVMHVALEHVNRRESAQLDKTIYNIAADYVVNGMLDNWGYKLPADGYLNHRFDNMSTRQVYDEIKDQIPPKTKFVCDILEGDGKDSEEEHHEKVITNIVKAVTQARLNNDWGSIPGEVAKKVEEILNPKLPWEVILQDYMANYKKEDYTWSRPNRRYWPETYLPSMHSEGLDQITVGIDTSGSINQAMFDAFMAEVTYIFDTMKPKRMRVMTFDTHVRDDLVFEEGDTLEGLQCAGGGGTNVQPLINAIVKDCPDFALIFSDLELSMPDLSKVDSDLFWIKIGKGGCTPKKGTIIEYS